MKTPYGMMMVITSITTPARPMTAMYSPSIACRYRSFARCTLLRVFDALQQGGVLGSILVAYRLRGLVERGLVRLHELHALRLQLVGRLGSLLVPERALLDLRFAGEFPQERLV